MYRPKSNAVWFNLPGVVAAYQPVRAPNAKLARINVANEQRTPGRYAAAPGVAPSFNPVTGWTFNGSTQYLNTGVTPTAKSGCLIAYSNGGSGFLAGSYNGSDTRFGVSATAVFSYSFGSGTRNASTVASGVRGISAETGYVNGISEYTPIGTWSGAGATVYIGARHRADIASLDSYFSGNILAVALLDLVLAPAQMWLASRQMAYCHVNPDWSAWGRRRRYYYAPSAAAALAFSPLGSGVVGSSVVRRIV